MCSSGWFDFNATKDLFNSNVDLGSSYSCGDVTLMFNSSEIDYKLNGTLTLKDLRVQAFFKDSQHGQLGSCK